MTGSRIVYDEGKEFVNVQLNNRSDKVFFVQSWTENSNKTSENIEETPYAVIPPIAKLEANTGQVIRTILTDKQAFPDDRESVSYFSFLQVPANTDVADGNEDSNKLVITIKHKVKLFYRPKKIANYETNWKQDIQVDVIEYNHKTIQLRVTNNRPLYLSMSGMAKLEYGDEKLASVGLMVAPYSYQDFEFSSNFADDASSKPANFTFSSVNDQGGLTERKYPLYF